jgi:hypothetical protein
MSHSISLAGCRVFGRAASFLGSILCLGLLSWQASAQQVIATASTGASGDPFNAPQYVAYDKSENLFVSDSGSSRVRRIDAKTGLVTTVAGTGVSGFSGMGGAATLAQLGCPAQMVFDSAGNLFISDACDHVVWKVTPGTGGLIIGSSDPLLETISNYAGNGATAGCNTIQGVVTANQAAIDGPAALAVDTGGNVFVASQGGCENLVLRVDAAAGTMASTNFNVDSETVGMAFDPNGNLVFTDFGFLRGFNIASPVSGQTLLTGNEAQQFINFTLGGGVELKIDTAGNLFVGGALRTGDLPIEGEYSKVVLAPGGYGPSMTKTLIAGGTTGGYSGDGGDPLLATFNNPHGIAVSSAGNLFIADTNNNVIRAILNGAPTPTGAATVTPLNQHGAPETRLTVTFSNVTSAGVTSVVLGPTGPAIPPNFELASVPPEYFDIVTTALYSGPITVCIDPAPFGAQLLHFINGVVDPNQTAGPGPGICTIVNSLSPFALVKPVQQNQAPAIASANSATFTVGAAGSFTVMASGFPAPTLAESGGLPSGITFNASSGELNGTPTVAGIFPLIFTAHNGVGSDATQNFTLNVNQAPAIGSANAASFTSGVAGSFTVTATGFPTPALQEIGALPGGILFTDNHNGTGTLSGTPSTCGTFPISFTASNGIGADATQSFTLTVSSANSGGPIAAVSPTSVDFGNVRFFNLAKAKVTLRNTGTGKLTISNISLTRGAHTDWDDMFFLSLCGSSLAPGNSCAIYVFYFADEAGTKTATLNIKDNAPDSPQTVTMTGTEVTRSR